MVKGSCLCGAVRWSVDGPLREPSHCHCSMCRKAHGSAFASFTVCAAEAFSWEAGTDQIKSYTYPGGLERAFCKTCGGCLPDRSSGPREVAIPLGGLEGATGLSAGYHIFAASAAPWHQILDTLPRHDAYPDTTDGKSGLSRPDLGAATPGQLRGSCLCGEVAYEVEDTFAVIHNCHCSRCRRARGAAHATNGFVKLDQFRFVRGENAVRVFQLPGAKAFGQAFCTTCGSAMPRRNMAAGLVSIPFGSLDDAPSRGPDDHIFVGSKSDWYQIADNLPQFEAMPG